MSLKRKLAVAAAGLTPALLVVLPAGQAGAHGYISTPGSRQAQCARGVVPCGPVKYEPQSVEGPKGLRSCSGGLPQFGDLDDDSKPWRAAAVGNRVDFTWTFTARHATTGFEYFLGGKRIAAVDGGGKQPPASVVHSVDLGGAKGRQKLLAVWTIADTPRAFYSCVDLDIRGGDGRYDPPEAKPGDPPITQHPANAPKSRVQPSTTSTTYRSANPREWQPNTAYGLNEETTYAGKRYRIIQRHTSLSGWEPPATPALWQLL